MLHGAVSACSVDVNDTPDYVVLAVLGTARSSNTRSNRSKGMPVCQRTILAKDTFEYGLEQTSCANLWRAAAVEIMTPMGGPIDDSPSRNTMDAA